MTYKIIFCPLRFKLELSPKDVPKNGLNVHNIEKFLKPVLISLDVKCLCPLTH